MALLFQSNPDQWDLRAFLKPGGRASWFVNQYLSHMKPGVLTLFWEAQGRQKQSIKGLYGWGILLSEPRGDEHGRLRVPLIYVERWISAADRDNKDLSNHNAPVPGSTVLTLKSWETHRLAKMPIGTNFIVEKEQLEELSPLIMKKYPRSAFPNAVKLDLEGTPLTLEQFELQYVKEEAGNG